MRTALNWMILIATLTGTATASALQPLWEYQLEAPIAATPVPIANGILVAAGSQITALTTTGAVLWSRTVEGELLATPALDGERIYAHSTAGLTAFDADQEPVWFYPAEDQGALVDGRSWGWGNTLRSDPWAFYRSSPAVVGDAIIFGDSEGVHAVDTISGERRWARAAGPVTADIVVHDDAIIVADWNNRLTRVNPEDGSMLWTFTATNPAAPFPGWIGWTGLHLSPTVHEDTVYFGTRGTYFYALDATTGRERWSSKHGTSWIGSPALIHGNQVIFGLSDGQALIGFEREKANQTLFTATPGPVFAAPKIIGNHLIAGTLAGVLIVVDLTTGEQIGVHHLHDGDKAYSDYFIPDPDSGLSSYEFTRARMATMKSEQRAILSLAIVGDLALIGTGSGEVIAFDLAAVLELR